MTLRKGAYDSNATKPSGEKAAADDKDRDPDRAAIQKSAQAFVDAFNKGNAKAVAALWTPRGEYFEDSGLEVRGREAIENAYEQLFKKQIKAQIEVEILSIHFPSRDTAIEEGTIRVKPPHTTAHYHSVPRFACPRRGPVKHRFGNGGGLRQVGGYRLANRQMDSRVKGT